MHPAAIHAVQPVFRCFMDMVMNVPKLVIEYREAGHEALSQHFQFYKALGKQFGFAINDIVECHTLIYHANAGHIALLAAMPVSFEAVPGIQKHNLRIDPVWCYKPGWDHFHIFSDLSQKLHGLLHFTL